MTTDTQDVIAIDGKNSTGKSSLASGLSKWLGVPVLNTGQLYRSIAFTALDRHLTANDVEKLVEIAATIKFGYTDGQVSMINDRPVTSTQLDSMSDFVKHISHIPELRGHVRGHQISFAENGLCIVEGRDIGSVVFPEAIFKVWLECARWRRAERMSRKLSREVTVEEIDDRDRMDAMHDDGRLVMADDAVMLNSTHLEKHQLIAAVEAMMLNKKLLVDVVLDARQRQRQD